MSWAKHSSSYGRRETGPDQTRPEHPITTGRNHPVTWPRSTGSFRMKEITLGRLQIPLSEPSSPIPTLISFAINQRARNNCYIPGRQADNPQVCLLSNLVTVSLKAASFKFIIPKLKNSGSQLWVGSKGVNLGKNTSLRSNSWPAAVQLKGVIWHEAGEGLCMADRGRKL